MSARDFCSPLPQFGDWSDHSSANIREQKRAQWNVDKLRERLLDLLSQGAVACEDVADCAVAEAGETIEETFRRLADEWSKETAHISSADDLVSHRRYQEIIKLGWGVVPYLLIDLQQNRRFWFPALYEITRIRPYDPSDSGNGKRMTEAWVRWGRWKELI
jgi:hypothetical protein